MASPRAFRSAPSLHSYHPLPGGRRGEDHQEGRPQSGGQGQGGRQGQGQEVSAARLPSYHPLQGRPGKAKLKKRASPAASTVAAAPRSAQQGGCGCAAVMWWGLAERYILYPACSARLLPGMRGAGGGECGHA